MAMILRSASPSPFGRKVRLAAKLCGLADEITVKPVDLNDTKDSLKEHNPLAKIPCLITEDGSAIYDSRVILAYMDERTGGKLIPTGDDRIPALKLEALCDGLLDAAVLQVYEKRYRPEALWHQPWLDHQANKVERALEALEGSQDLVIPDATSTPHVGAISLACALGYLDFRFDGAWRTAHPELVVWHGQFAEAHPAYGETAPDA